jgi:hypothetical protein
MPPKPKSWLDRFWAKVRKSDDLFGCWEWTGAYNTPKGQHGHYRTRRPVFRLSTDVSCVYAHRLILAHETGKPYDYEYEAAHRCDNVACVRVDPEHVYWATPDQNRADRYGTDRRRA